MRQQLKGMNCFIHQVDAAAVHSGNLERGFQTELQSFRKIGCGIEGQGKIMLCSNMRIFLCFLGDGFLLRLFFQINIPRVIV